MATVSGQPGEGPFDDPTFWQDDEALDADGSQDGLQDPTEVLVDPLREARATVSKVTEDDLDATKLFSQLFHPPLGSILILPIGSMDHHRQQKPEGVDSDMSLATGDFLACIVTMRPPFCGAAVLTDWLSITAALGVGFLPTLRRTFSRSLS